MSRRPIAGVIFLGVLVLVGVGGVLGVGNRALQYGIWDLARINSCLRGAYAHTSSSADRQHLIDTRGINLLPRPLRRCVGLEAERAST
jgi:hypothetical protein